jgi:hypothetical protein
MKQGSGQGLSANCFWAKGQSDPCQLLRHLPSDLHGLDDNPFFERESLLSAFEHLGSHDTALALWQEEASSRQIVLPLHLRPRRYGPLPCLPMVWTHPYCVVGSIVMEAGPDHPEALSELLRHVRQKTSSAALLWYYVPQDSALYQTLKNSAHPFQILQHYERACLHSDLKGEAYLQRQFSKKHLKNLNRQARRLQDMGEMVHQTITADQPQLLEQAFEDFIQLEGTGWKGKAGTALMTCPADRQFFLQTVKALATNHRIHANKLILDGKPLAVVLTVHGHHWHYLWKIAYDETYDSFSPGMLLMKELTAGILNEGCPNPVDGMAVPHHPMLDRLWGERRSFVDLVISLDQRAPSLSFGWTCLMEKTRERLKSALKKA